MVEPGHALEVDSTVTAVSEHTVSSLREYTDLIEKIQLDPGFSLWYRGCTRSEFPLQPSLYRHPNAHSANDLAVLENQLLTRFKQRSIPYLSRHIDGDWDYLFLMQHHGVPTRLLDWSENPYIALYFALDCDPRATHDAAVWALNPSDWNEQALKHISYSGGVLSPEDDQLRSYSPGSDRQMMNTLPVAIYGAYNSPRIIAQRGAFAIFGKETTPMETIYKQHAFPTDSLRKIVIPKAVISSLHSSILSIGYTASVIYPDLDGLAIEMKHQFGFLR